MGRHTYSDVVPFVMRYVWSGDNDRDRDTESLSIFNPYGPVEDMVNFQTIRNGWVLNTDLDRFEGHMPEGIIPLTESYELGKHNRIYSSVAWKKGDMTVYVVNESEWESGGGIEASLVADSREAIQAFYDEVAKPFATQYDDEPTIDENDAVQQTL